MPDYPPVGFHFEARVLGLDSHRGDLRFSEVGGLSVDMQTEDLPEGGENRFVQKYPSGSRYPDLVLKRGLLRNSAILAWIEMCIGSLVVEPHNVDVSLLDESNQPLITWHIMNAFPTKWAVSDLNAMNNSIALETLQMHYQYFTLDRQ